MTSHAGCEVNDPAQVWSPTDFQATVAAARAERTTRYRGRHRAHRFSVTVLDLQQDIAREDGDQ